MIRNCLRAALIFVLIANIYGCAQLQRKFIPKRKPKKEEYSFYHPEEYKPGPPHKRYQKHYMLWHNWHLELERADKMSHLRNVMSATEALRHLTSMKDLLEEEKAKELKKQIDDLEAVLKRIKEKKKDVMRDVHSRRIIGKIERIIINEFSYGRMKNYIKRDRGDNSKEESEVK